METNVSSNANLPNGTSSPPAEGLDQKEAIENGETEARLEALARERSALRDEVTELRKSLEELQGKHEEELGSLRAELEETQSEKEHTETQYRNLLGRVNTIKSQLGERLKSDAVSMLALPDLKNTKYSIGRACAGAESY